METQVIKNLIEKNIPKDCYIDVAERKNAFGGGKSIRIFFAAVDYDINNVSGQKPQAVSLNLDLEDLELRVQGYGGCGGNRVDRDPDLNNPDEKYLAMVGVRVPFRTPKKEEGAVLKAIEKFAQNWVKVIKENKAVLRYKNLVDYDKF